MASPPLEKTKTPGIYKRGGRYVVVYRDARGRQCKAFVKTMSEARDKKATLRADVARGEYRTASKVTFADFAEQWINTYAGRTSRGIEEHTRDDYRRRLEQDASPFFGRIRLAAIEPQHIKEYAAKIAARGVTANTVRLGVAPVRALLADAFEQGLIRSNPASGLRLFLPSNGAVALEDDAEDVKALTEAELAALLGEVPAAWRLFFRFLAESGCRIGEAIELRHRDIDADGRWLHVRRRYYRGKVGKPKGRKTRRVRLSVELAALLEAQRRDAGGDELVFQAERGSRLEPSNLMSRVLKPAAVRAGLGTMVGTRPRAESWVGFHTFRHTCATRLFRGGWNAVQVQKFLGHSDPGFTLRTYVHLLPEDLPEVPFGSLAPVEPIRRAA